jgi:hypothetical protein
MFTNRLEVTDYGTRSYVVRINASWITITDRSGNVLVERHADDGPWYDPPHVAVVDALQALEKAVFALVDVGLAESEHNPTPSE